MCKIIDIETKQERKETAFIKENAERIISHIMRLRPVEDPELVSTELWMIHEVVKFIEINSDVEVSEIVRKLQQGLA